MRTALLLALLLFLPAPALALQINEIMYDLQGSDGGREWVEVYQNNDGCANLTQWKFFEANTNHGITLKQGDSAVCSGAYAVITDDAEKFLLDHIDYSGSLFDSAFSLSNTGETIALKNPEGNITDSVAYSSATGANGNGRSLERNASGWFESAVNATPGYANSVSQPSQAQSQPQNQTEQNQNSTQNAEQNDVQPVQQPSAQSDINPPSDYFPLIDFSIIGRSNHVPSGSSIEVVVSASSNYLVSRDVVFCTYVMAEALASDEACRSVSFAADESRELRFYNTLKPEAAGNLTLFAELRDGAVKKQKTAQMEVVGSAVIVNKTGNKTTGVQGPSAAFVSNKSDTVSQFIAWLKGLLGL